LGQSQQQFFPTPRYAMTSVIKPNSAALERGNLARLKAAMLGVLATTDLLQKEILKPRAAPKFQWPLQYNKKG